MLLRRVDYNRFNEIFFFQLRTIFSLSFNISLNVQQDHRFLIQKWLSRSLLFGLWWITSILKPQMLHKEAGYTCTRNSNIPSCLIYKTWIWTITINHLHGPARRSRVILHTIAQPINLSPCNVRLQNPIMPCFILTIMINLRIIHQKTNPSRWFLCNFFRINI